MRYETPLGDETHLTTLETPGLGNRSYVAATAGCTRNPGSTVAEQLEASPAFLLDEDTFVRDLTTDPPPIPRHFAGMARRNLAGPLAVHVDPPPLWPAGDVADWGRRHGWIVDTRPRAEFARSHFPGSVNVDANGSLAVWAGWTVPVDDPVVLVGSDTRQLAHARRELSRVGFDDVVAGFAGAPPGTSGSTLRRTGFRHATKQLRARREVQFLDVRDDSEWREGHLAGAQHVPAHQIEHHVRSGGPLPELPWVHCRVGYRAAVAASVVTRLGRDAVLVDDTLVAARRNRLPWCPGGCPADSCTADVRDTLSRLAQLGIR